MPSILTIPNILAWYILLPYWKLTETQMWLTHAGDSSVLHPAGLQPIQRGGGAQRLPGDHQLHQPAAGRGQPHGAGGGQQQRRGHGSQSPRPTITSVETLRPSGQRHSGCLFVFLSVTAKMLSVFVQNISLFTIGFFFLPTTNGTYVFYCQWGALWERGERISCSAAPDSSRQASPNKLCKTSYTFVKLII